MRCTGGHAWVLVLPLLVPTAAACQTAIASFPATTVVNNTALVVGQLNGLNFGTVIPGTPATIGPKSALAGKFVLHGQKNAEVRITFTLPAVLQAGVNLMPISFADDPVAGKLACQRNQDQQTNCTTYTPSTALLVRIRNNPPPQNTFYVWIGGKVSPAVGQVPGTYTGQVTMTAVYTGN